MISIAVLAAAMLLAGQATTVDLSALAAGTLEHAAQARKAAAARNRGDARKHVDEALRMARQARDAGRSAGMERDGSLMIPLASEVEVETTARPRRAGAGVTTRVESAVVTATGASLDITKAAEHLEAARVALERDDLTAAEASLAAVEQSVRRVSATGEMPRIRARENLETARKWASEGKPRSAREPLRAAAKALREYEQTAPAAQAAQAAALRSRIEEYARRVARDSVGAEARIAAFMDEMSRWP
ncbi:MAG TPA: hypothetical protein VN442_12860 [Bryobacteraceae bacterium]|nr:hypothetical protein [Bryobacteraceae bacterium]